MDQALKQEDIPSGGIADFIYSDEEIKLLEEKELQDLYGQNGIAQFKAIGKEMANFGRYGDDTVAHVETGELIVPRALIENNPKLKESIFGHLRELGVEDPERYVVGTSKNSLNPDTGLPEFFLKKLFKGAKKAVSSVAKGVSSALKGVGKALKKVAPIVVPIALNYFLPGLGQIYSGALGAGITSLLQGGSVKDALKSAFVGGATGAISAGFSGKGGFGENIAADFSGGSANVKAALGSGSFEPLTSTAAAPSGVRDLFKGEATPTGPTDGITKASFTKPVDSDAAFIDMGPKGDVFYDKNMNLIQQGGPPKPSTFYDTLKDYGSQAGDFLFGTTPTNEQLNKRAAELIAKDTSGKLTFDTALKQATTELSPDFLRRFGPSAALGIAGLSAAGAFDTPEDTPLPPLETGFDLYRKDPDRFNVADINVRGAQAPVSTQTSYGFQYNPYVLPTQPFQTVAEGGEIFPRRNGGISPREGTPGKDSVRAMLMPGEFVMTTDAVKGLGGGNLDTGIKNMYSVMSKLEKRGKAMA